MVIVYILLGISPASNLTPGERPKRIYIIFKSRRKFEIYNTWLYEKVHELV